MKNRGMVHISHKDESRKIFKKGVSLMVNVFTPPGSLFVLVSESFKAEGMN